MTTTSLPLQEESHNCPECAAPLVEGKLDYKQASILGYYLQLALSNVGKVGFEEPATAD